LLALFNVAACCRIASKAQVNLRFKSGSKLPHFKAPVALNQRNKPPTPSPEQFSIDKQPGFLLKKERQEISYKGEGVWLS
jgi:hypothetical protein